MTSVSPANGQSSIPPVVTSLASPPPIAVGHNVVNGAASSDHGRKSSLTISAAGATGYRPNGGPITGLSTWPTGAPQFGALNAASSPAASCAVPQPQQQSSSSLSVAPPPNPRTLSPQSSPSPIPQPPASGGRPPMGLHAHRNSMNFGSVGGESNDGHRQMRPSMPHGPHATGGPHSNHLRRESSQSAHADMGNVTMPTGPSRTGGGGGGYSTHGGRGRGHHHGSYGPHHPMSSYLPGPNPRNMPNAARGGSVHSHHPYSAPPPVGELIRPPFPNSPHRHSRSPVPMQSIPVSGMPAPGMPMQALPMGNPPPPPSAAYQSYHPHVGAPQVKPSFSTSFPPHHERSPRSEKATAVATDPTSTTQFLTPLPPPDLTPGSGFMEQYLMMRDLQGAFGFPQGFDSHYSQLLPAFVYQPNVYMSNSAGAPRPPPYASAHATGPSPYAHDAYGGHHGPPPSMSRTSSAVSDQRPASGVGQVSTPSMTPGISTGMNQPSSTVATTAAAATAVPAKISPTPTTDFKIPPRKPTSVIMKDPNSGAVIRNFDKQTPSTTATATASTTPMVVTSHPSSAANATRPRSESKLAKTNEEKKLDMHDAVARKIEADKVEERRRKEEEETRLERERIERERAEEERRRLQEKEETERRERAERETAAAEEAKRQRETEEKAELAREEARAKAEADGKARAEAEEKARAEAQAQAQAQAQARVQAQSDAEEKRAQRERDHVKVTQPEAPATAEKDEDASRDTPEGTEPVDSAAGEERRTTPSPESVTEPWEVKKDEMAPAAVVVRRPVDSGASTPATDDSMGPPPMRPSSTLPKRDKPPSLDLAPIKTSSVEPAQPSAALQSLRSAKFIEQLTSVQYPASVASPNPALNAATAKGRFKYHRDFLMQFQPVFSEKPSLDWENRLKDTVGSGGSGSDSARPQSARTVSSMGSRSSSARPSLPQTFPMGSFSQTGRTLPPGTTSDQRLAMSDNNMRRPTMNNPLAPYARPGGFSVGGPTPMQRTGSASTMPPSHVIPQSPRLGNRSQRNNSKRREMDKPNSRVEEQAAKTMPLTAGQDLKPLLPSSTGWKPRSVAATSSATGAAGPPPGVPGGGRMDPEMVQRKVKANLNKMTPEKFEKISDQLLEITAQSKDESDGRTLRQVIQLTFEKATDEAHWASMYARFCRRMLESVSPEIKDDEARNKMGVLITGGPLFRKYLLDQCQREFEQGWKINLPPRPEGNTEEAAMLSDEYYIAAAAKRRGLGLIAFIGELYLLGMLTEKVMHGCLRKLIDYEGVPEEAEVESLTKLLRTVGQDLDRTEKGSAMMDAYFERIKKMMEMPELPSRLRFMLMDILDLRKSGWAAKERNKGPQTIQEVRETALREQAEKEAERARQQNQRHGGGRLPSGRGDARQYPGGGQYGLVPPPDLQRNTVGMDDLRRLNRQAGARPTNQAPVAFAPSSTFTSRSNSGRRMLGPNASIRAGEESGTSSRTGTPPTSKEKESSTSANTFGLLAGLDGSGEAADSASPPSAGSSPPTRKSKPAAANSASKDDRARGSASTSASVAKANSGGNKESES